ncbi:hypothetical protein ABBQ38_007865 [Trebouxia sp. C0009 RCD-2024]
MIVMVDQLAKACCILLQCRWPQSASKGPMRQGITEAHRWNTLPPDIIKSVLERLSFRDACNCRNLSSCWASVVRASVPVELVIPAKRWNLKAKVRRLQQTAFSTALRGHWSYTFVLAGVVSVTECSSLLLSLVKSFTKQGKVEVPYQVLIQLLPPQAASVHKAKQRLATIVAATDLLASHNIKVCISLDVGKVTAVPAPDVLHALAPVIQHFGNGPVDADPASQRFVTDSHVRALLPGINCITSLNLSWRLDGQTSLQLLAQFGSLRQLELQLDEADDLRHLSGLKGLLELRLNVAFTMLSDLSCGNLLENNKDSLLHVSLSAGAWDDKTFIALSCLCKLRTFSLSVCSLQHDDAEVLAQLRASQSVSITIRKLDGYEVVAAMVPTMQNLTSLTLTGLDLTSTDIQPQPRLQMLTLCGGSLESSQLKQMVHSYPSLKCLILHALQGLQICPDILSTLVHLPLLTTLCLSSPRGLSAATIGWVDAVFRAQQSIGLAQPKINLIFMSETNQRFSELCIDYTKYPVFSDVEFDERRATHTQRCWAQIAYPGARVGKSLRRMFPKQFLVPPNMLSSPQGGLAKYILAVRIANSLTPGLPFIFWLMWFC